MIRFNNLIAKYIIRTIIPYFVFAWLLLSVILFVQQASRYSDIFFNSNLPTSLIWQLTFALIPSVISFTCPMAILVGTIIGTSKLQDDSELVVIRASGVSNFQITVPVILFGVLLSFFAFLINLKGVPLASQVVRKVAAQSALHKLESPIEPGVFNTEIQGFTIYVKNGDIEKGTWKNIFIYTEDKNSNQTRLITSQNGRIDTLNENSELVLEKASVNTFSSVKPYKNLFTEKVETLRLPIQTKRGELIGKLSKTEESPEEMGLSELSEYAKTKTGKEKAEAYILWNRKLILSITPLIFALLGASLVLRFNRGGKGFGIFLALVSLVAYYLVALLGEQLARTETISILLGSLLPIFLTCVVIIWLFLSQRLLIGEKLTQFVNRFQFKFDLKKLNKLSSRNRPKLETGILDFDIVASLFKYFLLTLGFLVSVYLIFTAFELWKFAGNMSNGVSLLLKYLFFLIPFIYVQIAPSALMIAMLATYVIKSRQNEIVIWTASGQSIYRLLLPCFITMMVFGFVNWQIQERILPRANRKQDSLRSQLRSNGVLNLNSGKYWVANENRIYTFELPEGTQPVSNQQKVQNLAVYQFSDKEAKLQSFIKTDSALWEKGRIKLTGDVEKTIWVNDIPTTENSNNENNEVKENYNPFTQTIIKPNHLNSNEVAEKIVQAESDTEQRTLEVALEKKYATLFLPLVITLFTAPFAVSLSSRGKVVTVGYAVAVWLLFMGVTTTFEQFGTSGFLPAQIAVWGPMILFALIGGYLLTRIKT